MQNIKIISAVLNRHLYFLKVLASNPDILSKLNIKVNVISYFQTRKITSAKPLLTRVISKTIFNHYIYPSVRFNKKHRVAKNVRNVKWRQVSKLFYRNFHQIFIKKFIQYKWVAYFNLVNACRILLIIAHLIQTDLNAFSADGLWNLSLNN